jgi:hypothetical protein
MVEAALRRSKRGPAGENPWGLDFCIASRRAAMQTVPAMRRWSSAILSSTRWHLAAAEGTIARFDSTQGYPTSRKPKNQPEVGI